MLEKIIFFSKFFISALPLLFDRLGFLISAKIHHWTYTPAPTGQQKNIIVIGGSFGGNFLAVDLAKQVPNNFRVLLIEKKSHFNFTWLFPRISVAGGFEHEAFIPYQGQLAKLPKGSLEIIQACVTNVDEHAVTLKDGTRIEYAYLAIATGSTGVPPWHLATGEKRDGVEIFKNMQRRIAEAKDLIVVGGGAVGVELATDAKSKYPEKNVSLIHSRSRLLNTFGPKLHEFVMGVCEEMKLDVYLEERVQSGIESDKEGVITLKSGQVLHYDFLIQCTGQRPASDLLTGLCPSSISPSGTILVKKTLQIVDPKHPNIYALGDVAETGGFRMGRSAGMQAIVVAANIIRSIKGEPLKEYQKLKYLDGSIDLTVGLGTSVLYVRDGENEILMQKKKAIDLDAGNAWRLSGARPFEDSYDMKLEA